MSERTALCAQGHATRDMMKQPSIIKRVIKGGHGFVHNCTEFSPTLLTHLFPPFANVVSTVRWSEPQAGGRGLSLSQQTRHFGTILVNVCLSDITSNTRYWSNAGIKL